MCAMKANGEMKVWLHSFLTLALDGAKGLASRLHCFPPPSLPGERPSTHSIGTQAGSRGRNGLDDLERKKSLVPVMLAC